MLADRIAVAIPRDLILRHCRALRYAAFNEKPAAGCEDSMKKIRGILLTHSPDDRHHKRLIGVAVAAI